MRDTLIIALMALGVLVMAKTMPASAHAAPSQSLRELSYVCRNDLGFCENRVAIGGARRISA